MIGVQNAQRLRDLLCETGECGRDLIGISSFLQLLNNDDALMKANHLLWKTMKKLNDLNHEISFRVAALMLHGISEDLEGKCGIKIPDDFESIIQEELKMK